MPERFGRFVLLEQLETGWRGAEYRAAALAGTELERLVSLLRVNPALAEGDALVEHLRAAARMGGPRAIAIHEVGRVDGAAFVASDLVEGKSLRAVLARSRKEGWPIAPDNALQMASRVAAAVEHAHGHVSPEGGPFVHGMIDPDSVVVSYEGDVSVRGFGWWTSRVWGGHLTEEQLRRLAPEQLGGAADPRSDVFGVGALLLECLTGSPPDEPLAKACLLDGDPLPPPIAELLEKALRQDPAARFGDAHELRRALDALLFSGDFSPTTFNLAYFMYTLYRDVVDNEARVLERERQARYADAVPVGPRQSPDIEPAQVSPPRSEGAASAPSAAPASVPSAAAPVPRTGAPAPAAPAPAHAPSAPAAARPASARVASRPTTGGVGLPVKLGLAAVLLAAVAGGFLYFMRAPYVPAPTPAPTPAPEEVAALARVRELEARLQAIEAEKAQAEAAAAEAARERLEAEAARKGRAVDRAAVARAEEEAARKVRAEQEQRQEAEKKKIAEEMHAEEARLQAARAAAAATPTPTTAPTSSAAASRTAVATAVDVPGPATSEILPSSAPSSTLAAAAPASEVVSPGPGSTAPSAPNASVVHTVGAPGVTAPVLQKSAPVEYPQLAKAIRVQGAVVVSALVDEKGRVIEAKAVSPGNEILRQAAVAHVLQREYVPGQKDGVPVKVRILVHVSFKFQN